MRDGFFGVCLQCSLRLAPAAAVALAVFEAVRCFWVSWGKGFLVVASLLDGSGKSPGVSVQGAVRQNQSLAVTAGVTLRIKLLPGAVPVLSYLFNC